MAKTMILEQVKLREAGNLKKAKKAFDNGFSSGKGDWNYSKIIGDLAFWVEDNKDEYVNPDTYGAAHVHSLGSGGYYGISLHPNGDKSYEARAVFKVQKQGTARYYLWVYAIAMHGGSDIGNYKCFPKVIGGEPSFRWVQVSVSQKGTRYLFATDATKTVSP
jgi:hypothetical protein